MYNNLFNQKAEDPHSGAVEKCDANEASSGSLAGYKIGIMHGTFTYTTNLKMKLTITIEYCRHAASCTYYSGKKIAIANC